MSAPIPRPRPRLFLALWPDATVRAALREQVLSWGWPDAARRYDEADWHLTLHFLGNLPFERLAGLRAGLAVDVEPFELVLDRAELWRSIAVLTCEQVPPELLRLHAALGQALQRLGLEPDARPYRPHLTLARSAVGAQLALEPPRIAWPVRGYALVRSTGDPRWRYDAVQQYPDPQCKPEPHLIR
ncbi:MAG: 2'-5' RNA ligase [Burkholderiales bacterium RIFOXYC12_FULL_65_23]|uniref:RNA 2',3'-cyclic phosphodiesterase n=1 Tax=Malikia spinosa TaxID=86180 RepID=UPI0008BEDA41|nr:RNA 2',3'-cyclic phosphodiesterase [Malikia spinosa]OGB71001.1 MAG: 2'-5' RNA ligase [Burkholderiales bacterium RIFOXYC12_FULL_65_23]